MVRRSLFAALLALALPPPRSALAGDQDMGRRLQEALRAQRGEIHACYAESLARDPKAAGELLVRLTLGAGGRVDRAEVLKDQTSAEGLAACLLRRMGAWSLPQLQAAPGDQVVFPLVFHPDEPGEKDPATLKPRRKPAGRPGGKKVGGT